MWVKYVCSSLSRLGFFFPKQHLIHFFFCLEGLLWKWNFITGQICQACHPTQILTLVFHQEQNKSKDFFPPCIGQNIKTATKKSLFQFFSFKIWDCQWFLKVSEFQYNTQMTMCKINRQRYRKEIFSFRLSI